MPVVDQRLGFRPSLRSLVPVSSTSGSRCVSDPDVDIYSDATRPSGCGIRMVWFAEEPAGPSLRRGASSPELRIYRWRTGYLLERRALWRITKNTMIKMTRAIANATMAPVPTANTLSPCLSFAVAPEPRLPGAADRLSHAFIPLGRVPPHAPRPRRAPSWPPSLPPPLGCSPRACRRCWQGGWSRSARTGPAVWRSLAP